MAERTDEVTEEDSRGDPEARAAIDEARSVIDDIEAGALTGDGGADSAPAREAGGDRTADAEGGTLPSPSPPSIPSPSPPSAPSLSLPEAGEVFSARVFLVAVGAVVGGLAGGNLLVPLGPVGGALGMFVAAFLFGLVSPRRAYLEVGLASLLAGGITMGLANLAIAARTVEGVPLVAVVAAVALVAGLLGLYLGRDLRAGLTRSVP